MKRLRKFSEIYESAKNKLVTSGVESVNSELLNMFWYCFGMERADVLLNASNEPNKLEYDSFCRVLEKRCSGMPLQYAIGEWEFMGLRLSVGEGVLIPREDTAVLVNSSLDALRNVKEPKVVDLCSGSGCVALALEKNLDFECDIYAVELSKRAFRYLAENRERCNGKIKLINGDILKCHRNFDENTFDLVVSNPPYIESKAIKDLQAEVLQEPRLALDGGADGLEFYRSICEFWISKLKVGGTLAFEIGQGQSDAVESIMKSHGVINIEKFFDINNIVRVIIGKKAQM